MKKSSSRKKRVPQTARKKIAARKPERSAPVKLRPDDPAARDEGPRLIPLRSTEVSHPTLTHYVNLADTLLGNKRKKQD